MTRCNGQPVAKISDEPSKTMDYDPSYVAYLREVFQVPEVAGPCAGRGRRRRRAARRAVTLAALDRPPWHRARRHEANVRR